MPVVAAVLVFRAGTHRQALLLRGDTTAVVANKRNAWVVKSRISVGLTLSSCG